MEKKFLENLKQFNFKKNTSILLAVSGGEDSVTMLDLFSKYKDMFDLNLFVCHFNHSLRKEADFDENFVKNLSIKYNLKFFSKKEDVEKFSYENKFSTEEGARILRYKFFYEVIESENIDFLATAHNKDDLAETVIMRILRGTGINGLIGITKKRNNIIRPLLDFSKAQIKNYVLENNLKFVQDNTNFLDVYKRNNIRLNLIPKLKKDFNPNVVDALCKLSTIACDYDNISKEYIFSKKENLWTKKDNKIFIDINKLKNESKSFRYILYRNFFEKISKNPDGISFLLIEEIDKLIFSKTGKYVKIKNVIFKNEYGKLVIFYCKYENVENKDYVIKNLKKTLYSVNIFDIIIKNSNIDEFNREKKNKNSFFINERFLKYLKIRNRKNKDFINLEFGKKKLKDLFIDEKLNRDLRNIIPIFEIDDNIIWVSNLRRANIYLVDETDNILKIEVIQKENV
ncbi:tRNA(Ile)-lysidine synthetase [Tissierellia bacterium KA00581]|nr:tRNA(Ile)-lysidine synthetase [Tissierellia bacterium KA00581]